MQAHEILRAVARKLGIKYLAAELKVSPKLFQKWTQPVGPAHDGRVNPAERVLQITQITGNPRLLEWLCEQAGGRFVHGEELRELICQDCQQLITRLERVVHAGANKPTGDRRWELADGSWELGTGEEAKSRGRCRYRLANGRCGRN